MNSQFNVCSNSRQNTIVNGLPPRYLVEWLRFASASSTASNCFSQYGIHFPYVLDVTRKLRGPVFEGSHSVSLTSYCVALSGRNSRHISLVHPNSLGRYYFSLSTTGLNVQAFRLFHRSNSERTLPQASSCSYSWQNQNSEGEGLCAVLHMSPTTTTTGLQPRLRETLSTCLLQHLLSYADESLLATTR